MAVSGTPQNRSSERRDPTRNKFGLPQVSLPTPDYSDLLIVETKSLAKGTRGWRRTRGSKNPEYPAAVLISQSRTIGDDTGFVATWVYSTDRYTQDSYNAATTYTAQSGAHRILTRTSLVRRDADNTGVVPIPAYAPLADLSPDSQVPTALLTQEQAVPAEEPYNSLYLRVTRIFEDFGTRQQQDAWNLQDGTGFPYLSDAFPRYVRRYRFPANAVPVLTIGSTADTQNAAAILTAKVPSNESARVVVILATFEAIPTAAQQAALGSANGTGGLGLSITYPEDPAFPVVSLKSVLLNDNFTASPIGTLCPVPNYTTLVITDENRAPSDDAPSKTVHTREFQLLPGAIVTSTDSARLPRTLTAIPGQYLNGDNLVTTRQKVAYGTAADPLTGGVLSSKVEATSRFYATKTNVSRGSVTYPVLYQPGLDQAHGSAKAVEQRQIVEAADAASLPGAVDAAIAALLATTSLFHVLDYGVTELSPTQAELRFTSVTNFPALVGAENNAAIPERFLSAFQLETDEDWIDTTVTPATSQVLTGNGIISCKIVPESDARAKRTTIRIPAGSSLPILTSTRVNARGQVETIVEEITDGTESVPAPTTTSRTDRQALGGGYFLSTTTGVPTVYAGDEYTARLPIVIPEEFRSAALTTSHGVTTAGTAAPPTLGPGEYERTVQQVDAQTIRTTVTSLNLAALPLAVVSTRPSATGLTETVTRILEVDTTAPANSSPLLKVSFTRLGNALAIEERIAVPSVAALPQRTIRQPEIFPPVYLADAAITTDRYREASYSDDPPDLGTNEIGVIEATSQRLDIFTREVTTQNRDASPTPPPLQEQAVSRDLGAGGQAAIRDRQIVQQAGQDVSVVTGFGILSSTTRALSPSCTELITESVPSFPLMYGSTAGAVAQQYPGKYRFSGGEGAESFSVQTIDASEVPYLSPPAGQEVLSVDPLDQFHSRVRIGTRSVGGGTSHLSGQEMSRFGPVTTTWDLNVSTAASGLHVLASEASPAGEGKMEVRTSTSADTATPTTRETQNFGGIPERFLAGLSRTTTETPVTPGTQPDSGTTVLRSAVRPTQNNPDRAILETTTLADGTTIATLPELRSLDAVSRAAQGQPLITSEKPIVLAPGTDPPALPVDFLTVIAETQNVGGGAAIQRLAKVPSWPVLKSGDFDERTGSPVSILKTFVDAATAQNGIGFDGANQQIVETREYDKWRSIQIVSKLNLVTTSRTQPINYRFSFPDTLNAASFREAYAETGNRKSWDVGLVLDLTQGYSGPCNGTLYEYFTFDPGTVAVPAVTIYKPMAHIISMGYYYVSGSEASAQVKTFQIPPTLHAAMTVSGCTQANVSGNVLPATTPTGISGGSICVAAPEPERYRFGLWIVRYVMITPP